jgi:hypothetical protein
MKQRDEQPNKKEERRANLQKKKTKRGFPEDDFPRNSEIKREKKKIQEEFEEEEWRDWDRYYNH